MYTSHLTSRHILHLKFNFKLFSPEHLCLIDSLPPNDGHTHTLTTYITNLGCRAGQFEQYLPILVKNCGDYRVYHLREIRRCFAAYCFGKKHDIYDIYQCTYIFNILCLRGLIIIIIFFLVGTEVRCPNGTFSNTGFTPGCTCSLSLCTNKIN